MGSQREHDQNERQQSLTSVRNVYIEIHRLVLSHQKGGLQLQSLMFIVSLDPRKFQTKTIILLPEFQSL